MQSQEEENRRKHNRGQQLGKTTNPGSEDTGRGPFVSRFLMPPGLDHEAGQRSSMPLVICSVGEGGGEAERTNGLAGDSGRQKGTQGPAGAGRTAETGQGELNRWVSRWQELNQEGFG